MYEKILTRLSGALKRDSIKIKETTVEFIWHKDVILENCPATQIYGFCLTPKAEIVLVRDYDETRFTLPGGGVDKGESPQESLIREFKEEAQFVPEDIRTLGTLEVIQKDENGDVIDHHQQVRFICSVKNMGNFISRKDGWETEERITVEIKDLDQYIDWLSFPTGKQIFKDLIKVLERKN